MPPLTEDEAAAFFCEGQNTLEKLVLRFALPRDLSLKFLEPAEAAFGGRFGPELSAWFRLFERYELEVVDPAEAELRAPALDIGLHELLQMSGPSALADLIGFFSAASVVVQADEMSYLATWAAADNGLSKVFYFHPSDWGLWLTDASLAIRVYRLLQEDRGAFQDARFSKGDEKRLDEALVRFEKEQYAKTLPAHVDPASLFGRTAWLVHALLGAGQHWTDELSRAATIDQFEEEKEAIIRWPHLGAYWLWAHYFFDNLPELEFVMKVTASSPNPVVRESRTAVKNLVGGRRVRLGERTADSFGELKEMFLNEAPDALFGPEAKRLHAARRRAVVEEDRAEQHCLKLLQEVARAEPVVAEALLLLEALERGGQNRLEKIPIRGGITIEQAMAQLAASVDRRFRPLLLARLERAAKVPDSHRNASFGLILAYASICDHFDEFHQTLERFGKANYGARRWTEIYRAYGRFQDSRAIEILAEGARAWLTQMDDWIRSVSDEPVRQLLNKDTLRTHELIAAILEKTSFSPADWEICIRAAEAAGELRSTRAVRGLRRAVVARLGRIEDGTRARVMRSLHQCEGASAGPFLLDLIRTRWSQLDQRDQEDEITIHKDVAGWLSGLLSVAPDNQEAHAYARTLLGAFEQGLRGPRPPRKDVIASVRAILDGIHIGEVRALADSVHPLEHIEFEETASTKGAVSSLRNLARTIRKDLGG